MRRTCCGSCDADRACGSRVDFLIVLALAATISCATQRAPETTARRTSPTTLAYFNEGKLFVIGVDVRAARLAGPSDFLPLQIFLENHGKRPVRFERESLVLERPDGVRLPVCTNQEFRRDYRRSLADAHLGSPFIETISGRFPEPPFRWQPIDFFPPRSEGSAPRDGIDVLLGDVVFGYVYFRQPNLESAGLKGVYKLLLKLGGSDAEYVVDLIPYDLH